MLKNESAQNVTKPMPLRLSHLPDSGGIFTLSNRLCMEKISRSVRKFKQAKKGMTVQSVQSTCHDDCAYHTVRTADVACSYMRHMAGPYRRHMAAPRGDMCQEDLIDLAYGWTYPEVTCVTTERVTHGKVMSASDVAG
jgi:hypothetical protein